MSLEIPDDARELDRDLQAYRRELRSRRRRDRLERVFMTRRWRRYGLSGPLVAVVLALVAVFGGMLALFGPQPPRAPGALPLASPAVPPGQVGGLLPAGSLRLPPGEESSVQGLRPAVLALVPAGCGCGAVIGQLAAQATEFRLPLYLVGSPAAAALLDALARGRPRVYPAYDELDRLAAAYGLDDAATAPTVLLVHADGVVGTVLHDAAAGLRLESRLATLDVAG